MLARPERHRDLTLGPRCRALALRDRHAVALGVHTGARHVDHCARRRTHHDHRRPPSATWCYGVVAVRRTSIPNVGIPGCPSRTNSPRSSHSPAGVSRMA